MDDVDVLTKEFLGHRPHLRAIANRLLGSSLEADDAIQEAWLRARGQDPREVENMQAWLTTIVSRICLNMLRTRRSRCEQCVPHVPDPVVGPHGDDDPEHQALLGDSVGLAMLMVLDTLRPAERVAFVMHDVFGLPFAEVAFVLERSEAAASQLASRARRRIREAPEPDRDPTRQRRLVAAFFAASRDGDFDALINILDPDVDLTVDGGYLRADASRTLSGAATVARHTAMYSNMHPFVIPALVNGSAGAVVAPHGRPFAVMAFTIIRGRIRRIDTLLDPVRLATLHLSISTDI